MKMQVLFLFLGALFFGNASPKQGTANAFQSKSEVPDSTAHPYQSLKLASEKRVLHWADSLKPWLKKYQYSDELIFIADMNMPMYLNRFYAINPSKNALLYRCLMAHGNGKGSTLDSAVFSNVVGSNCTSLGKYRMGKSLVGIYGKGYFLDGLDASNNNARKRWVVWHYYIPQPSEENATSYYYSEGCPLLSKKDFDYCDSAFYQKQTKPVLMAIYK